MDRTTGTNHVVSGGKRQFTDGPPGTTINNAWLNSIQEEIMNVIEGAGITPSSIEFTQLRDAIFATVAAGGFFNVPSIGLSIGSGGEGAYVSAGDATLEGEHHYTDFTLNSAHQLSVGSTGILIIRCTGTATINGSINGEGERGGSYASPLLISAMSGGNGTGGGGGGGGVSAVASFVGASGGGAYSAGNAGLGSVPGTGGSGKTNPLLLINFRGIKGGSGGSTVSNTAGGTAGGTMTSVSEWTICALLDQGVFPMGGGGGAGGHTGFGTSAGGGGGFVLIVAENIVGSGVITCNGGNASGYSPAYVFGNSGGSGGGGGGCAITVSKNNPSGITLSAAGGNGAAGAGGAYTSGGNGTNGFTKKYYPGAP